MELSLYPDIDLVTTRGSSHGVPPPSRPGCSVWKNLHGCPRGARNRRPVSPAALFYNKPAQKAVPVYISIWNFLCEYSIIPYQAFYSALFSAGTAVPPQQPVLPDVFAGSFGKNSSIGKAIFPKVSQGFSLSQQHSWSGIQ